MSDLPDISDDPVGALGSLVLAAGTFRHALVVSLSEGADAVTGDARLCDALELAERVVDAWADDLQLPDRWDEHHLVDDE